MARMTRNPRPKPAARKAQMQEGGATTKGPAAANEVGNGKLQKHRARMASIGAFLDQCFGEFKKDDPGDWDRRTYLMLVGMVYERLAAKESKISTNELVRLAKLFAESRRAEARAAGRPDPVRIPPSLRAPAGGADGSFVKVVREVYGVGPGGP